MTLVWVLVCTIACTLPAVGNAQSVGKQQPVTIMELGVVGGVGMNMHSGRFFALEELQSCCKEFSPIPSFAPYVAVQVEFPVANGMTLLLRPEYNSLAGTVRGTQLTVVADYRNVPTTRTAVFEHSASFNTATAGLSAMMAFRAMPQVDLIGGFGFGYRLGNSLSQSVELIEPRDYGHVVRNGSGDDAVREIAGMSSYMSTLNLGIRYRSPVGSTWNLTPGIMLQAPLTTIKSSINWAIWQVRLEVALSMNITREHPDAATRDPKLPDPLPETTEPDESPGVIIRPPGK